MTIYEHMVLKAPTPRIYENETDAVAHWCNLQSEEGWELVTATYLSGIVHYVFRKPVEMH